MDAPFLEPFAHGLFEIAVGRKSGRDIERRQRLRRLDLQIAALRNANGVLHRFRDIVPRADAFPREI